MKCQVSPFAALTGMEKQIRWLEYQSIRLPYVEACLETKPDEEKEAAIAIRRETVRQPPSLEAHTEQAEAHASACEEPANEEAREAAAPHRGMEIRLSPASTVSAESPSEPEPIPGRAAQFPLSPARRSFSQPMASPVLHKQYDAVIARIRQAELRSRNSGVQTVLKGTEQPQ